MQAVVVAVHLEGSFSSSHRGARSAHRWFASGDRVGVRDCLPRGTIYAASASASASRNARWKLMQQLQSFVFMQRLEKWESKAVRGRSRQKSKTVVANVAGGGGSDPEMGVSVSPPTHKNSVSNDKREEVESW
jgi:hypothetical protein